MNQPVRLPGRKPGIRSAGPVSLCSSCSALFRRFSSRPTVVRRWRFLARPVQSATFFYSAIFAAAAIADSHFKDVRRAQWDQAIESADRELQESRGEETELSTEGAAASGGWGTMAKKTARPAVSTPIPVATAPTAADTATKKTRRKWFERCCRQLAVRWRRIEAQRGMADAGRLDEHDPDMRIDSLVSAHEWVRFEKWAVDERRVEAESLPYVDTGELTAQSSVADYIQTDDQTAEETEDRRPWSRLHQLAPQRSYTSNPAVDSRLRLWSRRDKLADYWHFQRDPDCRFVADNMLGPAEISSKWQIGSLDGISGPTIHDVAQSKAMIGMAVYGNALSPLRYPPQSIESPIDRRVQWLSRMKTETKIAKARLATAKLVSRLGRAGGQFDQVREAVHSLDPADPLRDYYPDSIDQSIQLTRLLENVFIFESAQQATPDHYRSLPVALPSYTTINPATLNYEVYHTLCRLESGQADMTATLISLSRSLLAAQSPPNVTTFNLLLSAFSAPKHHRLFTAVFWEMTRSRIRHNEFTCATILYHFAARCDPVRFIRFYSKMVGTSSGLMLANPHLNPPEGLANHRFTRHHSVPERLIQKTVPHPLPFQYLIYGLFRFLPDSAVFSYIADQIHAGWTLSLETIGLMIRTAIANEDWHTGTMAWNLVLVASGSEIPDPNQPQADPEETYYSPLTGLRTGFIEQRHYGRHVPSKRRPPLEHIISPFSFSNPGSEPSRRCWSDTTYSEYPTDQTDQSVEMEPQTIPITPINPIHPIPKDVYVAMLALCKKCDQLDQFEELLRSLVSTGRFDRAAVLKDVAALSCQFKIGEHDGRSDS